jgi:hypothetical protein
MNERILAIDAGTNESGAVIFEIDRALEWRYRLKWCGVLENRTLNTMIRHADYDVAALEMVACYGMPVGREVFETCVWVGRFTETIDRREIPHEKVYRREVKMELCGSMRAKDANIRRAIMDIFPRNGGGKTPEVGTKSQMGALFGVKSHVWAALGVGITFDKRRGAE